MIIHRHTHSNVKKIIIIIKKRIICLSWIRMFFDENWKWKWMKNVWMREIFLASIYLYRSHRKFSFSGRSLDLKFQKVSKLVCEREREKTNREHFVRVSMLALENPRNLNYVLEQCSLYNEHPPHLKLFDLKSSEEISSKWSEYKNCKQLLLITNNNPILGQMRMFG